MLPYRPRRRSPHGCRQRESEVPSPPSALAARFAENLQTTTSRQRIVIHGREAVLDEVMVANAEENDGGRRCRCWRFDFDVVRLEERRPSVVLSSRRRRRRRRRRSARKSGEE